MFCKEEFLFRFFFSAWVPLIICRELNAGSVIYANSPVLFRQVFFPDLHREDIFYILRRDSTAFVPMEFLLKFMGWPRGTDFLNPFSLCVSKQRSQTIPASFLLVGPLWLSGNLQIEKTYSFIPLDFYFCTKHCVLSGCFRHIQKTTGSISTLADRLVSGCYQHNKITKLFWAWSNSTCTNTSMHLTVFCTEIWGYGDTGNVNICTIWYHGSTLL